MGRMKIKPLIFHGNNYEGRNKFKINGILIEKVIEKKKKYPKMGAFQLKHFFFQELSKDHISTILREHRL